MELLSDSGICGRLNIGRTTLWKLRKERPDFPKPVQVTKGCRGTLTTEIDAWITARAAERDAGQQAA